MRWAGRATGAAVWMCWTVCGVSTRQAKADVVVRVAPGDCPLIDPGLIDQAVDAFLGANASLGSRGQPSAGGPGLPRSGWIVDAVLHKAALTAAWREATAPYHREHVLPFLYENPDRFRVHLLRHEPSFGHLRWTVDEAADLELVRQILHTSMAGTTSTGSRSWRSLNGVLS